MPDEHDGEMTHMEFLKAQLFSSEADHAVYAAQIDKKRAASQRRRERRLRLAGLRALGRFARAVEAMDAAERRASITWLADKYLGVRL